MKDVSTEQKETQNTEKQERKPATPKPRGETFGQRGVEKKK